MAKGPVNCRYFYGDYHRGRNVEECRLLAANPDNQRPWRRQLCDSCPVPEIVITSTSRELVLEAEVKRKLIWDSVEVTFAICQKHMIELADPRYCPQCAEEQAAKGNG
ncbi:MAG: hypothetical protein R2867_12255 [Caldilineaceae bacterium]